MENFKTLGLPESLLHALEIMKFNTPTPIQAQTIPSALEGKDILGSAQTGTGKTGAFGIPLVSHVLKAADNHALVLTPTRELAIQVLDAIKQMLGKSHIKTALLIGGEPIARQFMQLKMRPQIIVGTPGRVNDHLIRGTLNLSRSNFLVLDEFDRMLDMGFSIQLEKIANYLPKARQTLMFSATIANDILKLANSYLIDPVRVAVGSTSNPTALIKQEIVKTTENDKYTILLDKLNEHTGTTIIFVKTKFGTEKLAKRIKADGHDAEAIHGDLRQHKRERVIKGFRDMKHRVLVATDVAARGLDISHIECVINYDLPQCPDDYIHRIGRTGRAGAEGVAISLVTPQDGIKWRNISKLMNPNEKHPPESSFGGKGRSEKSFKPRGSGFGFGDKKRSFGDKPRGGFGDKPRSFGDAPRGGYGDKPRSFGDAPRGGYGDKPRSFGDAPRGGYGDKPRSFGDSPRGGYGDKPRSFGDSPRGGYGDKPRSFGDAPRGGYGDKPRGNFGDKPRSFGDAPRGGYGDKPRGGFGDKPRSFGDSPRGGYGDKPRGGFGDKPRSFGDKPRGGKPKGNFSDRPKSFSNDKPKKFTNVA